MTGNDHLERLGRDPFTNQQRYLRPLSAYELRFLVSRAQSSINEEAQYHDMDRDQAVLDEIEKSSGWWA